MSASLPYDAAWRPMQQCPTLASVLVTAGSGFIEPATLPVAGTYTVLVDPSGAVTDTITHRVRRPSGPHPDHHDRWTGPHRDHVHPRPERQRHLHRYGEQAHRASDRELHQRVGDHHHQEARRLHPSL